MLKLTVDFERKTGANSRFAKAGVSCFYDSEVLNSSFVHPMMFSAENPRLRKAANRCQQLGTNAMTTEISVHCVSSLANHRSFQSLSCFAELLTTARTQNKKLPTLT
jgi:hypothetical protein